MKKKCFILILGILICLFSVTSCEDDDDDEAVPPPKKEILYGIWGSDENNFFTVGTFGNILHYDGENWKVMDSGVPTGLYGIWGFSDKDIFVSGQVSTFLHYDGESWESIHIQGKYRNLYGIWGSSNTNVFLVGAEGALIHYDGANITEIKVTEKTLYGIWGDQNGDIFIVGEQGTILRYDKAQAIWQKEFSGTTENLYAISGVVTARGYNVYAVGANGTVLYYDGQTWISFPPGTEKDLRSVWCHRKNDVFAVGKEGTGLHYDGEKWKPISTNTLQDIYGIYGIPGAHAYFIGEDKEIEFHDFWEEFVEAGSIPRTINQSPGKYEILLDFKEASSTLQFQLLWDDASGADIELVENTRFVKPSFSKRQNRQKLYAVFENVPAGEFSLAIQHKPASLISAEQVKVKVYRYNKIPRAIKTFPWLGNPGDIASSPLLHKLTLPLSPVYFHSEYPTHSSVKENIMPSAAWQWELEDYTNHLLEYTASIEVKME